jgi:hypothetical protein
MSELIHTGGQVLLAFSILIAVVVGLTMWSARPGAVRAGDAWALAGGPPLHDELEHQFALATEAVLRIPDSALPPAVRDLLRKRLAVAARSALDRSGTPIPLLLGRSIVTAVRAVESAAAVIAREPAEVTAAARLAQSLDDLDRLVGTLPADS